MRPIPADSMGHAHGLLRAIDQRGRLRTDEFVTEFSLEELFPPDLENALGRMRHFISYARAAGLVKEDRGVVELTEIGRRYIRSGEPDAPFAVGPQQAEWLRRQLREKHMTDSIFHGLAIGLSLLASTPPPTRVSTLDFGRSMAYLGRAGWDNENTLQSQGERHLILLQDMELIDADHRLTPTGDLVRGELTLPVHMSLPDIAAQLNPGGADAVVAAAEQEFAEPPPAPAPVVESAPSAAPAEDGDEEDNGYHTVGDFGSVAPPKDEQEPPRPPIVPRTSYPGDDAPSLSFGDPLGGPPSSVPPPSSAPAGGDPLVAEPDVVYPPPVESPTDAPTVVARSTGPASPDPGASSVAPPSSAPPPAEPPVAAPDAAPVAPPAETPAPPAAPASVSPPAGPAPTASPEQAAASAAPPPPVEPPVAVPGSAPSVAPPPRRQAPSVPAREVFVEAWSIRAAAEETGLRLPDGVYANVAAALSAGKHLLLTGAPGSGKTSLALAIARAAAQAGHAKGATVITGAPAQQLLREAAARGRWVIADELDQADPDAALKPLSTLLAGVPVTLDGEEAEPAAGWRIVATWNGSPPRGVAVLRRFAAVDVARPTADELRALLQQQDPKAQEAVEMLLALGLPIGAGVLREAANHIKARQAAVPTDASTLADEAVAAYITPLLDL